MDLRALRYASSSANETRSGADVYKILPIFVCHNVNIKTDGMGDFMTNAILAYVLSAAVAYLLGSINFSIIITKKFKGTDVRRHGSGNAGATNVLRTAGKLPAALTFVGDFLKCVVAILLSMLIARLFNLTGEYSYYIKYTTGIVSIIGHIFPLYFDFKGGKGVTSAAAVVLMLDWRCFVIGISIFIIVVLLTRIVSLGSLIAVTSVPIMTYIFHTASNQQYAVVDTLLMLVITVIVFVKHHANISRLLKGTEPRIHSGTNKNMG